MRAGILGHMMRGCGKFRLHNKWGQDYNLGHMISKGRNFRSHDEWVQLWEYYLGHFTGSAQLEYMYVYHRQWADRKAKVMQWVDQEFDGDIYIKKKSWRKAVLAPVLSRNIASATAVHYVSQHARSPHQFLHDSLSVFCLCLQHNLCFDNCHSHVALALNLMNYNGSRNWNMVKLALLMLLHGKYVR